MKGLFHLLDSGPLAVAIILTALLPTPSFGQSNRYALVIGNSNYLGLPSLKNPANDAKDIATTLSKLGFQVTPIYDASRKQIDRAITAFRQSLARDRQSVGFFYYAGHGVQAKGVNYLIPVGAEISSEADLEDEAVSVQRILGNIEDAQNRVNIVVLDACRDNPLPSGVRGVERGLAVVAVAPPESIVLFSTAANQTALDGSGRNSPFARALLNHLADPDDISVVIKEVTAEVRSYTGDRQIPFQYTSLDINFSLNPESNFVAPSPASTITVKKPTLTVEKAYGSVTVEVRTKGTLYLNGTSMGLLSPGASARLDNIETGQASLEMRYENGKTESHVIDVPKNTVAIVSFAYMERPKVELTWTDKTAAGSRMWGSITSSSDGSHLAATIGTSSTSSLEPTNIFTSTDGGATWTDQTAAGSRNWASIASSSDGSHLAAVAYARFFYADIFTSTDGGATWTDQTAAGSRNWASIASSSDGSHLAACAISNDAVYNYKGADIYTSADSGATWTDQTAAGSRMWESITSSSDGSHLAAFCLTTHFGPGDIYTSADSGATWTDQTAAGSRNWASIASSSDGSRLAACVPDGNIYTSTDGGVTWTDHKPAGSRNWRSIASSADGSHLAVICWSGSTYPFGPGDIYTSADSGATWTDQTAAGSRKWMSITSSADGSHLAACVSGGDIFTGQ